jgi:hypothetical protein
VKEESVKSLMLQTDKASIYEMAGNKKIKPWSVPLFPKSLII